MEMLKLEKWCEVEYYAIYCFSGPDIYIDEDATFNMTRLEDFTIILN